VLTSPETQKYRTPTECEAIPWTMGLLGIEDLRLPLGTFVVWRKRWCGKVNDRWAWNREATTLVVPYLPTYTTCSLSSANIGLCSYLPHLSPPEAPSAFRAFDNGARHPWRCVPARYLPVMSRLSFTLERKEVWGFIAVFFLVNGQPGEETVLDHSQEIYPAKVR